MTTDSPNQSEDGVERHTPGPWHWSNETLMAGPDAIHLLYTQEAPGLGSAADANARLIAAAPEQHGAHIKISEIANRVFQMGDAECRRALQEIHAISRAALKATQP